jgi:beta-ketodecanoyl-[acyl-carrier-protein] synthase
MEKSGVLDPARMRPRLDTRTEDQLGIQAEMSLPAIHEALAQAGRAPSDVDAVIVGCSNLQRAYPAVAIEIQDELGADRLGLRHERRMLVGDVLGASAVDALRNGSANCVVVVNPRSPPGTTTSSCATSISSSVTRARRWYWSALTTPWRRSVGGARHQAGHQVLQQHPQRLRLPELVRGHVERDPQELVFRQNGQMVFREVCPMVAEHITIHLTQLDLTAFDVRRFWLHQANLKMNQLIAKGCARPARRPTTRRR